MIQNEYAAPVDYNTVLNPALWDHDRLKSEARGALIRMAEDFIRYIDIPVEVEDIIITGGNVNYNYTRHSDIDLHLVVDFERIECDREAAELFDTKRLLYRRQYNLSVKGIPVELYVEDRRLPAVSGGSYSLLRGEWINQPRKDLPEYNEQELTHWIRIWQKLIRQAVKTGDLHACRTVLQLLKVYRRKGLSTPAGEFSIPNLVYKSLRNDQVIQSLIILIDRLHDQSLSII